MAIRLPSTGAYSPSAHCHMKLAVEVQPNMAQLHSGGGGGASALLLAAVGAATLLRAAVTFCRRFQWQYQSP